MQKITDVQPESDIRPLHWQELFLRLINRNDLAEAIRDGILTVKESINILNGLQIWQQESIK